MADRDRIDELIDQWRRERPDLDPEPMALIGRLLVIAAVAGGRIDRAAAEHGLDRGTGDVLFTLRRAGAPYRLAPSQLVRALLVTSGTMTNRLDNLERRGLVERLANPTDRRGLDVQLTRAGVTLADELVTEHVANEEEMLASLSRRERDQLATLTRKLLAGLGEE